MIQFNFNSFFAKLKFQVHSIPFCSYINKHVNAHNARKYYYIEIKNKTKKLLSFA
jgi:hypothetical protein